MVLVNPTLWGVTMAGHVISKWCHPEDKTDTILLPSLHVSAQNRNISQNNIFILIVYF